MNYLIFAFTSAWISGNAAGYFIPAIINDAFLSLTSLISIFFKRPVVVYTRPIAGRWPLNWYLHSKIRPAYSEVTLLWGVYFGRKIIPQWILYNSGNTKT